MFARCVICCKEKHLAHPERTFHRFPKNELAKSKWIEAIKSEIPCTSGMVCSDHFVLEDFCQPIGYGYIPKHHLQENAIPKLKIVGLSMTDIRLQRDSLKEEAEQRVVVHPLDSGEKENMYLTTKDLENSTIKQLEVDPFDFFTQSSDALNCTNENITLDFLNDYLPLSCGNENISLDCLNEFLPLSYSNEFKPLSSNDEFVPLSCGSEFLPLNYEIKNIPLNCGNKSIPLNSGNKAVPLNSGNKSISLNRGNKSISRGNKSIPLNCGNENITDPDLKRIISGNMDKIDLNQECNDVAAEVGPTVHRKNDYLETNLKTVIIKMPEIGLRSFNEDDFTSSLAWKIFVKFILHNRKETRSLRHKCDRLQQKVDSYQKMFDILRKGGRIRIESNNILKS